MTDNEILVTLPGGSRVEARLRGFSILTDQPVHAGGENAAPSPFDLFLASLATCAGYYVLAFCQERKIPTEGITLVQRMERGPKSKLIEMVRIEIHLPAGFPAKYKEAVIKAADKCAVKAHLAFPPDFEITSHIAEA
ncbi:MAG: OsmC family protein [Candidatus Aminicenantes bacterium]|nr:OsmC family protein [Candidatus Aminicenantes bacterium]